MTNYATAQRNRPIRSNADRILARQNGLRVPGENAQQLVEQMEHRPEPFSVNKLPPMGNYSNCGRGCELSLKQINSLNFQCLLRCSWLRVLGEGGKQTRQCKLMQRWCCMSRMARQQVEARKSFRCNYSTNKMYMFSFLPKFSAANFAVQEQRLERQPVSAKSMERLKYWQIPIAWRKNQKYPKNAFWDHVKVWTG